MKKTTKSAAADPSSAAVDKPVKSASSSLPAAILVLVLGLAGAAFMLQQTLMDNATSRDRQLIEARATGMLAILEHLTGFMDDDSQSIARNPLVLQAIRAGDTAQIGRLEQQLSRRAYLVDAVIRAPGLELSDAPRKAPINYAAMDHIAKAITNQAAAAELLTVEGKTFFYKAVPVLNPRQPSRVEGMVMLVYDASAMLTHLDAPNDGRQWHVKGIQQLPGAPVITLFEQGSPQSTTPARFAGLHPHWSLEVQLAPRSLLEQPGLASLLLALAIPFLAGLLALILLQLRWKKSLVADCQMLEQALQGGPNSPSSLLKGLALPELRALTPLLSKSLERAAKPATDTPSPAPAKQTASATAATDTPPTPAPTVDDVLDIDILDMELDDSMLTDEPATPTAPTINPGIFRAYDIRGIVGQDLDADTAYWIGRAVGSESLVRGESRVVAGRDGRLSGPELLEALIRGLQESGCEVLDVGMVPTPLVYFGTHQLNATSGVMLTGSHNPANYNGFKIVIAGETLAGEQVTALYQRIVEQNLSSGQGQRQQVDLLPQYINHVADDVAVGRPLKVVVDCGNGVAGVVAPQLLEEIGCTVIPLYCEVDGNFPNHHPDPGKPENLQDLIRKVREENADLGLAFDGDGDRLGVVTDQGEIIYPDRLMMLLAKDVVSRNPGADILFDVKCSRRLATQISRAGGRPVMWKTGHSLMKAKIRETGALLAGEMSGHIFFQERWFGFDDGIYSAARLLEILSMDNRSSHEIFAQYQTGISTPELNIEVTDTSKFEIIQSLHQSGNWGDGSVNTLDGIRVDYPGGWGLIRASNTTPVLVLRFEGDSEDELQRIQNLFREQLLAVAPNIHWPFS